MFDMLHFFRKSIIDGVNPIYDPFQPTNYILYLDVTNLYGAFMSEYRP